MTAHVIKKHDNFYQPRGRGGHHRTRQVYKTCRLNFWVLNLGNGTAHVIESHENLNAQATGNVDARTSGVFVSFNDISKRSIPSSCEKPVMFARPPAKETLNKTSNHVSLWLVAPPERMRKANVLLCSSSTSLARS